MDVHSQEVDAEAHRRKTVSFTHRQLGIGGGVLLAIMSIGQLREMKEFFIGDTAATIVRIEKQQTDGFAKLEDAIKDLTLRATAEIASSELRCEKRADKLDARLMNLENYAFKGTQKSRAGSTN